MRSSMSLVLHRGIGMRDVALLVEQEAQGLVRPVTEGDAHPGGRIGIAALRHDFGASAYSDGQRAFTVKHVDKGLDLAGRAVGHGGPAAGQGRADVLDEARTHFRGAQDGHPAAFDAGDHVEHTAFRRDDRVHARLHYGSGTQQIARIPHTLLLPRAARSPRPARLRRPRLRGGLFPFARAAASAYAVGFRMSHPLFTAFRGKAYPPEGRL